MSKLGNKAARKVEFGLFTLPVLIGIVLAFYIPFFLSMYYSLTDWNGIAKQVQYIGLDNFKQLWTGDPNFTAASIFTIKFSLLFIVLSNGLALAIAVLLDRKLKTAPLLRAGFFIPYVLSLIIVGFIWKFIFSQGFQSMSDMTGWPVFDWSWLGSPKMAFLSVLLVSVWQSIGFYIVIYIAGLQSVPADLLEAATVDGAGPLRRFWGVTLPLLAPSVTIATFMALTNSIKVFDVILSLTGGGPGGSTYSVSFDIYRETFQNNQFGYGTAKALVLFVVVLFITIVQLAYFKRKEVEQ